MNYRSRWYCRLENATLQGFVKKHTAKGAKAYTDEASAYDADVVELRFKLGELAGHRPRTEALARMWNDTPRT